MITKPIIFSGPMVRALLREVKAPGTGKTMTRRLAYTDKGKPTQWRKMHDRLSEAGNMTCEIATYRELLWVRETWAELWPARGEPSDGNDISEYRADSGARYPGGWSSLDADCPGRPSWRSAIHMLRRTSRLTLEVTATRIERLQEISEDDARREGIMPHVRGGWHWHRHDYKNMTDWYQFGYQTAAYAYAGLWRELHGPDAWNTNPEVVVLTFTPRLANVDDVLREIAA